MEFRSSLVNLIRAVFVIGIVGFCFSKAVDACNRPSETPQPVQRCLETVFPYSDHMSCNGGHIERFDPKKDVYICRCPK